MRTVLTNIGTLLGIQEDPSSYRAGEEMSQIRTLENAWLVIENDLIACYGEGEVIPFSDDHVIDCRGGMVMPAFCDSHTHLVFAGSRVLYLQ